MESQVGFLMHDIHANHGRAVGDRLFVTAQLIGRLSDNEQSRQRYTGGEGLQTPRIPAPANAQGAARLVSTGHTGRRTARRCCR